MAARNDARPATRRMWLIAAARMAHALFWTRRDLHPLLWASSDIRVVRPGTLAVVPIGPYGGSEGRLSMVPRGVPWPCIRGAPPESRTEADHKARATEAKAMQAKTMAEDVTVKTTVAVEAAVPSKSTVTPGLPRQGHEK